MVTVFTSCTSSFSSFFSIILQIEAYVLVSGAWWDHPGLAEPHPGGDSGNFSSQPGRRLQS